MTPPGRATRTRAALARVARTGVDVVVEGLMWMGLGMAPAMELTPAMVAEIARARSRASWRVPDRDPTAGGRAPADLAAGDPATSGAATGPRLSETELATWTAIEQRLR